MIPTITFLSEPPRRFPVVYYNRSFTVNGVSVVATITNLTAAFLEDLGDELDDDTLARGLQ